MKLVVILASADSAADLAALTLSTSRSMSPAGAAGVAGVGGRPTGPAADVMMETANVMLPPRAATTAASTSLQDSAGMSYHPGTELGKK